MVPINLREYYPHIHEDRFVEVSDDVAELFLVYRRSEASYARKARRYHAYFHLTVKTVLSNAFASFPFSQKSTLSVNCRNSSYMLH